jgi:hypothetical protein
MVDWKDLKNIHEGYTGIVIGNGPSLKDVSNDLLNVYPSFGTNKIYLKEGFTPTYYVCINPYVCEQVEKEIPEWPDVVKFARAGFMQDKALQLNSVGTHLPTFSYTPDIQIYEGFTVTNVCLQLAFYMGFDTILLYGVDHRFEVKGKSNTVQEAKGDDPNHFHPKYFTDGNLWQLPDLYMSEQYYRLANNIFREHGKRIINLTKDSALEVFEKVEEHAA